MNSIRRLWEGVRDQAQVMEEASELASDARKEDYEELGGALTSGQESQRGVRAAQIAAAWLPTTLTHVQSALRSGNDDLVFAMLCALTDVPRTTLMEVRNDLLPDIWNALSFSTPDSSVDYMSSQLLGAFDSDEVWKSLIEFGLEKIPAFALSELRNGLLKSSDYTPALDQALGAGRNEED